MKACLIAYTYYEMDFRVRRYAEMLAGSGNRVDVIALRENGKADSGTLNGVNVYRVQGRGAGEKGLAGYLWAYLRFMVSGMKVLAREHARSRYGVVHVHNVPDFLVFMAIRPRLSGAKVILDIHDILPEFFCQKFGVTMDSRVARLLRFVERRSVRFADHVIIANDLWREKLVLRNGMRPDRCTTIMNYPPLGFYGNGRAREEGGPFRLVYPGTLSYQHGVDILVRAVALAVREIPDLQLHIYAHDNGSSARTTVEGLIREQGLSGVVFLHKSVPPETLAPMLSSFDLGVVPKRAGIFASEAFSTKVLDFMAAGIPVVASRTKIDEWYFGDSQIQFFAPEDPEDLARRIVELHRDPERRASLARKGKEYIEENNWDAKKPLYEEILGKLGD